MSLEVADKFMESPPRSLKLLGENYTFGDLQEFVSGFIRWIESRRETIISILMEYETHWVAADEMWRALDLLKNLKENKTYFGQRTGLIKVFLPQNQPLYALTCFVIVPSFQARKLQFRPPQSAYRLFEKLLKELDFHQFFPNVNAWFGDREGFTIKDADITDAVIFTGSSETGLNLRKLFSEKSLFILNGSGHNPIVVTETADLEQAVENILKVSLYNQGQDCSAPSSILIHEMAQEEFKKLLLHRLKKIEHLVGPYENRDTLVGPNTNGSHVVKTAELFRKNKKYYLYGGDINPINQLIFPTVFLKPLVKGPVFEEYFAPVIMLQPYTDDRDLKIYFEHPRYFQNAMYLTVFGKSPYVESLKSKNLHLDSNIIYNSNVQDIKRGYIEYGGLGPRASCVYWGSTKIPGATLPQREIFRFLLRNEDSRQMECI